MVFLFCQERRFSKVMRPSTGPRSCVSLWLIFQQNSGRGKSRGRSRGGARAGQILRQIQKSLRALGARILPHHLFSLSLPLSVSPCLFHTLSLSLSLSLSHTHTHTHTHTGFRSPLAGAKFLFFGFRVNSHPRACPVLDLLPKFARDSAITQNLHVSHR